ncbi:MAG: GNAT family N-acetyltransferase [Nitrospinota bacterium]
MERFPNAFAIGELIYLRHPTEEDARAHWHAWLSDPETTRYLTAQRWPNTVERQVEFLKSLTPYGSRMALAIVVKENHRHIGIASLSQIDYIHRYAYISNFIGEADYRKGPYALEAYSLMLEVAFLRLNLRMVLSSSVADHAAVRAIHERCGIREKGRIEKQFWVDGRYCDNVISAVTQEEWLETCRKGDDR